MPFLPLLVPSLKGDGPKEWSGSLIAVALTLAMTLPLKALVWLSVYGDGWVCGHLLFAAGKRCIEPSQCEGVYR